MHFASQHAHTSEHLRGRRRCATISRHEGAPNYAHSERLRRCRQPAWFEKWGWKKRWDSGSPLFFAAIASGEADIFLCKGAQGSRGRGSNAHTFGADGDETADKGVWMSVWVDDVDAVYQQCVSVGLDITFPPTDMPWKAREMHVRHPDGHVFRVSKNIEECD